MKAHELLSDRSKWTRGAFARDKDGRPCDYSRAACWCMAGAIYHCYRSQYHVADQRARDAARRLHGMDSLLSVNDRLGYDAVLAVLEEADV